MDVEDALDHLHGILIALESNYLKTKEDDECYEVIAEYIEKTRKLNE